MKGQQIEATMTRISLHGLGVSETHQRDSMWYYVCGTTMTEVYPHGYVGVTGKSVHWSRIVPQLPTLSDLSQYALVMGIMQGDRVALYHHITSQHHVHITKNSGRYPGSPKNRHHGACTAPAHIYGWPERPQPPSQFSFQYFPPQQ